MQVRTDVSKGKVPVYGMEGTRLRDGHVFPEPTAPDRTSFRFRMRQDAKYPIWKVPVYGIGYQKTFDEKEPLRKYVDIVSLSLMRNLAETDLSKKEVRKHVGAIQINGKLSLLQRKLANVLLWNAYDELQKEEKHRIRIRDLAYLVGFDSNDLQVLKDQGFQGAKIQQIKSITCLRVCIPKLE